jgi:ACT domain-containing protein
MKKIIITVVGKDMVGIIARISAYLEKSKINILDISQTVVQDYFNMMMIADGAKCPKKFDAVSGDLAAIGSRMGLEIRCQKSEIFEMMHRV